MESRKNLTATDALQLVSAFFEKEWLLTKEEDVQVRRVTGGFCHSLHLISRNNAAVQEPTSVLIRHFGTSGSDEEPLGSNTTLMAAEQAVFYHEMGRKGWGPKIYGLFRGGRLEEYLDAHPLTAPKSMEANIRRDVARSYARLHSLQLPLRKNAFKLVVGELKAGIEKKNEISQQLLATSIPSTELAAFIADTDWDVELDWVSRLFEKYQCKSTIAIGDTNFLNVLVKNYESECRTILIDYETGTYSYRGIDSGGHFTERMYCWSHPDNVLTGYPSPDLEEQRSFCQSYLQEMQDSGQEMTANDTLAHLHLESEIGQMYQLIFSFLMCFMFAEVPSNQPLLAGLVHMSKYYRQLKQSFVQRHEMIEQETDINLLSSIR